MFLLCFFSFCNFNLLNLFMFRRDLPVRGSPSNLSSLNKIQNNRYYLKLGIPCFSSFLSLVLIFYINSPKFASALRSRRYTRTLAHVCSAWRPDDDWRTAAAAAALGGRHEDTPSRPAPLTSSQDLQTFTHSFDVCALRFTSEKIAFALWPHRGSSI